MAEEAQGKQMSQGCPREKWDTLSHQEGNKQQAQRGLTGLSQTTLQQE